MALAIAAGDCFRLEIKSSIHWFFVISAPEVFPENPIVLVPMTKVSGEKSIDDSCRLSIGDHPNCDKPSYIEYKWSIAFSPNELARLIEMPTSKREMQASPTLLERLRKGAEKSELLPDRIHTELWKQGILGPL